MAKFYCEHCGNEYSSVGALTSNSCSRHPDGPGKGRHELYEGALKAKYTCKYCGNTYGSIAALTSNTCGRHPAGPGKGRHAPGIVMGVESC
jgi:predicted nucleic acid-binding Zn ribbon protein